MKNKITLLLVLSTIILSMAGCKPKQQVAAVKGRPILANAPVIVYKTKADYSQHVPVGLSADKMTIVSYPAPGDVYYGGDLAYPVSLEKGYYLDKRGIDENAAFTKWTYYEYSRLPKTPTQAQIKNMLLEIDPFIEIYHCGSINDFDNLIEDLNKIILKGKLSDFKRLK